MDTTDATDLQYTYYLRDHQGTALVAAHADGSANRVRRFEPWGLPVSANGVAIRRDQIDGDDPGFTGHKTIRSAGLFHANGRVGDPRVGFISPDPILLHGSLISINRYVYGLHNPLTFVDLSGYAPSGIRIINMDPQSPHYLSFKSKALKHRQTLKMKELEYSKKQMIIRNGLNRYKNMFKIKAIRFKAWRRSAAHKK